MSNYVTWFDRASFPVHLPVQVDFVMGQGVAAPTDAQPPSFTAALAKLDELIAQKKITPRDLKCRFDGCVVEIQDEHIVLTICIGPTHYYACRDDIDHPEQTAQKMQRGIEEYQDAKRYLNCGMGVVVVPYTEDGRVLLGVRHGIEYEGWWNGLAGWLPFERDLSRLEPAVHARLECIEELGIVEQQLETLEFLGLVSFQNSFETDVVFCAPISSQLAEAIVEKQLWKRAQDAYEHESFDLFVLQEALLNKQKLMPSTEFGLHALSARQIGVRQKDRA